jgi:hypothetical protein
MDGASTTSPGEPQPDNAVHQFNPIKFPLISTFELGALLGGYGGGCSRLGDLGA